MANVTLYDKIFNAFSLKPEKRALPSASQHCLSLCNKASEGNKNENGAVFTDVLIVLTENSK